MPSFCTQKLWWNSSDALFEYYIKNCFTINKECEPGKMGYFMGRVGPKQIISYLKSNPKTAELMKKGFRTSL